MEVARDKMLLMRLVYKDSVVVMKESESKFE